jgi:3-dehydroquinate synthase
MNRPPPAPRTRPSSAATLHQRLRVPFDYPVHFCRDVFDPANPLLASVIARRHEPRRHRIMVFLDRGVESARPGTKDRIGRYAKAHAKTLALAAPVVVMDGGEAAKTDVVRLLALVNRMAKAALDRQNVVLAIGGGGLLDSVGLAASLVHRGVRLIRLPTTVAGQNDVGVGVKTGLDAFGAKNYLGTFAPPFAVINDFDFLDLLPDREWVAGISEAFKVAMIKDRRFFRFLCRQAKRLRARDRASMERLVVDCARLHLDHIRRGGDPFEMGTARPLDFGHWSAHELELMSGHRLRHGEAVAIGIALDSYLALRLGLIGEKDLSALLAGLQAAGLPVWTPLLERRRRDGSPAILAGLGRFREHLGGALTLTLPCPVGRRVEVHDFNIGVLRDGIQFLRTRGTTRPCT